MKQDLRAANFMASPAVLGHRYRFLSFIFILLVAGSGASNFQNRYEDDSFVMPHFQLSSDWFENGDVDPPSNSSVTIANKTWTSLSLRLNKYVVYDYFLVRIDRKLSEEFSKKILRPEDTATDDAGNILLKIGGLAPSTFYSLTISNCSNNACAFLESLKASTSPAPASIPPPIAKRYDFHVDRVFGDRRSVRIFWNALHEVARTEPEMGLFDRVYVKVFERTRLLDEGYLPTNERHLLRDISLRAHAFLLFACDHLGRVSEKSTRVEVPAQSDLLRLPAFVATSSASGEYVYRWLTPSSAGTNEPIFDVDVVWCDTLDHVYRTCVDLIEHLRVDGPQTEYRTDNSERYKGIALRVDTESSSSGVVRPACETAETDVGTLSNDPKMAANGSHLLVEWGMRCPEEGMIFGVVAYNLSYCAALQNGDCSEPETKLWLKTEETALKLTIGQLIPNTPYKFTASVVLADGNESTPCAYVYHPATEENKI